MRVTGGIVWQGRWARFVLAAALLSTLSACWREDEAALRDRMERWFSIGETVAFHTTRQCSAAVFRLVQMEVKAPLAVVSATPDVPRALARRGAVALDAPGIAPDAALVEIANSDRATGMNMRRAALEGRLCMNDHTESAFRYALDNPRTILAYTSEPSTIMLMDPHTGLLVVAMGAVEWL